MLENVRLELYEYINTYGLSHEKTLSKSQELDEVMNHENALIKSREIDEVIVKDKRVS